MHFHSFSPEICDFMLFVRFLDFRGPAEGRASRNRSGHILSAPSLWSQWIARTSRWSRQYVSTSIPKSRRWCAQARQTASGNRFGIHLATYIPLHFAFLNSKGDPGKLNGAGSIVCVHIDSRGPPVRFLPISMCQVNSEGKGQRKATVYLKQFVYQRSHLIFKYFPDLIHKNRT